MEHVQGVENKATRMVTYPDDGLVDGEDQDGGVKPETTKCSVGPAEEFGLQPVSNRRLSNNF